jgi:Skp family chaperone for outer membrane proteins
MELVQIKTNSSLSRDISSGAVINTNRAEYENYLQKRRTSAEIRDKIQKHSEEITEIKHDLSDIKQMLLTLIKRNN